MQAQTPRYNGHPVQSSPRSTHAHSHSHSLSHSLSLHDPADSDDGGQNSADDLDLDDDHHEVTRLGKRKRPISVSCELCKQRKVKCDRGQPSCGWCTRNGAVCEYKERKKPGLRAGYGRELEQRLDNLEEKLRVHSEILQSLTSNTSPASGHGSGGSALTQHAAPSVRGSNSLPSDHGTPREVMPSIFTRQGHDTLRTPQAETALFLQKPSTSIDFGLSTAPGHESFPAASGISPQSHMQTAMAPSAAAQDYYGAGHSAQLQSPSTATQNSAQMASEQELPPYDLLYALVDLYFKHINTWCPILHRKTTLDSLFGPSMIDDEDKILLHAIVATALRYSTDARLTDESRQRFHDTSKQRVLLYGMEHLSVKSLQALVILALDLCGSSNGPPGWNIMALITRAVVQLGLAVESNSFSVAPSYTSIYTLRATILPEPRDFIEEESRRRLFWMVYLLDRYATIATAFEFGIDGREIDRTLPCRDDLWMKNQKVETRWFHADDTKPGNLCGSASEHEVDKPENLGAFSFYIEILGILSKIHTFLKQPVDISALSDVETWQMRYKELDNMLAAWKFDLPGDYGNMAKLFQPASAKTLNCGWVMLHATHHTAVIRLHSSAAYPTTRSPIFTPSYSASQRCHAAVKNISALCEFVVANGLLVKLGPPFAFTLWVAARVLLVHGSTVERKLGVQIGAFVETLREMGRYWPVAARYCSLLSRVLDEHRDSERQGGGEVPGSVKILADMRRTAFDLDFLISRQPRHVPPPGANGASASNGGGNGAAGGWQSRLASATPASRTPAPNELEYLDVFDFFNVPRLPVGPGTGLGASADGGGNGMDESGGNGAVSGEFNITDFMVDANRDWLFPAGG
ncbi:fungal-specific transcription factor domain-containing protein [Chaetomidium leptoderma]|uniref:Fungal-specific transcription factor domain-containing protein n=1 Tax=Chaetomidium leptoderma TaxID=669021 RepID=A0AAN6VNL6_9PEZI|nr:fungal-specific transcription factor domain-containing protein [Chaetomidium leptoderma]